MPILKFFLLAALGALTRASPASPFANLTFRVLAPLPAGVRETWVDTVRVPVRRPAPG